LLPSRAAELLRNTELVLDALPRAIIVIEADGTIVAWNNVSTEFYGWTADEALGKSLYELVTPPALATSAARSSNERFRVSDGAEMSKSCSATATSSKRSRSSVH